MRQALGIIGLFGACIAFAQQRLPDTGKPGTYAGPPYRLDMTPAVQAAFAARALNKTQSTQDCVNGNFDAGGTSGWVFQNLTWIDTKSSSSHFDWNMNLDARTNPWFGQHTLVPNTLPDWANWQNGDLLPTGQIGNFSPATLSTNFFKLPFSCNGGKVLRLGNNTSSYENNSPNGHDGEAASFAFTVTPTNRKFGFRFAAFIQRHPTVQISPAFGFVLADNGGNPVFLTATGRNPSLNASGMSAVPNSGSSSSNTDYWFYQAPTAFVFEIPASYIGKTLSASFVTHGCGNPNGQWGGHSAYAFIDDLCDPTIGHAVFEMAKQAYCDFDQIVADGSCSVDAKSHTWRLEQCNASGTVVPNTAVTKTVAGIPSASYDVKAMAAAAGKPIQCGKHYKLTLTIVPNVDVGPLYSPGFGFNKFFYNPQPQSFTSNPASKVFFVGCTKPVLKPLKASYCQGDAILADGTLTDGETAHTWSLVRLDASGGEVAISKRTQSVNGAISGPLDLMAWYKGRGGVIVCDANYRVRLQTTSPCGTADVDHTFRLSCCKDLDCCAAQPLTVTNAANTYLYPTGRSGEYGFNPTLSRAGGASTKRLEVMIANVVRATSPWSGQLPGYGYVQSSLAIATSPNLVPVTSSTPFLRLARWEAVGPATLTGAILPMTLRFPAPVPGVQNYLKFTVKFTSYDVDCNACEAYQTYIYKVDGSGPLAPLPATSWPKAPGGSDPTVVDPKLLDLMVFKPDRPVPIPESSIPPRAPRGPLPILSNPSGIATNVWPPSLMVCCGSEAVSARPANLRSTPSLTSYAFTPQVNWIIPAARMEISMVSAAAAMPNGSTYPVHGFIHSPSPVALFAPPQLGASPFSHIARWVSSGTMMTNLGFPMMLSFPAPPTTGPMFLRFTMRYAGSTAGGTCRQCDHFQTYYFKIERGKNPIAIGPKEWPLETVDAGSGSGGALKRGGGGGVSLRFRK